ncbi:D-amino-acid oxidase-like [Physella acuta]|uniref:D-amino-acid oxidase-like n=1 Tax=Physella acuta TaxID=109671 RepID=UPI0027DE858C|nr:D-amino-acid oxidase-like [Physella acuta]
MSRKKVIILGAGVAGLSTAVCIQSCCPHLELEIVAEHFSPHTTSDGSGGFWEPYATGSDVDRFLRMGEVTFNYLMGLANSPLAGEIGVQLISGYTLDHGESEPSYRHIVDGYRKLTPTELARFPKFQLSFFF